MKSFKINSNDSGQRLDKYVGKCVPLLPDSLLYMYIRLKRIKVNGERAKISTRLKQGDIVDMYINDEFFEKADKKYDFLAASKSLDIVYEDENILILDKKPGLLSHPDEGEYNDTLITRVKRYLYEKGSFNPADENSFAPALVNRIDRNTRGIVIAAKNAQSLRILNQIMKKRQLHKYYICVVHGTPEQGKRLPDGWYFIDGWLVKDEKKNQVKIYPSNKVGSKQIQTKYRVIDSYGGLSLVEVDLLTGRTHQIRAHMAGIGHPLLGDGKYGINQLNRKYGYKKQLLCSYRLEFDFRFDAGILDYLNGKSFEINNIWFVKDFKEKALIPQSNNM